MRIWIGCLLALLLPCLAGRAEQAQPLLGVHTAYQVWNTSSGLPQDTVRQFLQTRDGYLWLATDGGLVRFDGIDFTTYDRRNTPQMQSDLVNALFEDRAGNFWIATSNGLLRKSGSRFTRFTIEQGLPSDDITSLHQDGSGRLCAETSSGSACLASAAFTTVGTSQLNNLNPTPQATSPDGTHWSAASGGLLRLMNSVATTVPMPEGFTGSDILTLYVDREGDLWVGSENAGAAIVRQLPFSTIGKKDGLAADQVRSVLQEAPSRVAQGDLWFGTSAGLTRLHQSLFTTTTVADGLASNEIIALAGSSDGDVWAGTPDGLSHLQHGRVTTLTASDGLPDDDIRSLLETRDHTLWIGTTHGLAHLTPGKASTIQVFTNADGLPSDVIGSLLEDTDGSLWIGTRAGLAHLQDGRLRSYTVGLKSPIITALGRDFGGTLWVGTGGGGLYEIKGDRLLQLRAPVAGELPDTIYGILDDGQGQIWISSPDGIYRIAGKQLHALAEDPASGLAPVISHYDVADGLRIRDCSSGGHPEAFRAIGGELLFATGKGVSVVDPANVAPQSAPPIALESVSIDDNTIDSGAGDLRVSAGHERIAFHYAGLSFASPAKVRYRYRLEPFDRTWVDAGARRTAYYTNIPPGRYRFRVAASMDGVHWSQPAAEIAAAIAPHYYQTWWFYALIALLLALLAWQLYLYRLRQVELRFDAVLAERGRIAREIHDTLAQDIVAISVQLDLVARLMTLSIDKAKDQLIATRDLVRKSLAEARSSIWDLRSQSSATGDLPERMRAVTRQVVADAPLKLNFQITGTYRPCARELEDELLRIAQEAVTNAVRHAQAQIVDVSLNYHATGVELRVRDDGRGFLVSGDKSGPPGHYGLRGMHERAERAHAELTVESALGAGTSVSASARIP